MKKINYAIWGVGFAAAAGPARLQSTRYLGTTPSLDRPTWPHLPEAFPGPVLDAALGTGSSLWLLGGDGSAWCCANASDLAAATCGPSNFQLAEGATRVVAGGGEDASVVALASGVSFALAKQASGCSVADVNFASVALGAVADLCVDDATSSLWIGGATGILWRLPSSPGATAVEEEASFMDGTGITALAVGYGVGGEQLLAVATELALYHSFPDPTNAASGRGWRHDWLQVLFDYDLSAARFSRDGKSLWLGGAGALYHVDYSDGLGARAITRLGGRNGAPVTGGVSRITPWLDGAGLAFATSLGVVVLLDPAAWATNEASNWRLLAGDRFLAGRGDSAVRAVSGRGGRLVAVVNNNATGVAVVSVPMDATVKAKVGVIQATAPRHLLWNGLMSAVELAAPGDVTQPLPRAGDNNGLYAGYYVACQSLRYAASGDDPAERQAARAELSGAVAALRRLLAVTGIAGFPARSLATSKESIDPADTRWGWNPSPVPEYEGWWFKGNTSSDEIIGHVLAYTVYHDLAAGDVDEKGMAANTTNAIMINILDNNLTLVDANGEPTLWGFWDPPTVNDDPSHPSERGPYSVQILSHLLAAHRVNCEHVGEPGVPQLRARYRDAFTSLALENGYLHNMVNQMAHTPGEISYNDVELTYLVFYSLARSCRPPTPGADETLRRAEAETLALCGVLAPWGVAAVEHAHVAVAKEHSALWDFIYGAFMAAFNGGEAKDQSWQAAGVASLLEYPEEIVRWSADNTKRADLVPDMNLLPTKNQSETSVRRSESNALQWCDNPFAFSSGGGGLSEENPVIFLIAYWIGRFHGFVSGGV